MTRTRTRLEVAFPIAVVLALVIAAAVPAVVATPDEATQDGFELDIDRAYDEPAIPDATSARIGDREYASAQAALDDVEPGDTVMLDGRFDERLVVDTPDVTVTTADGAVVDGDGIGRVVTIAAPNVTIDGLWIRSSGADTEAMDAGIFIEEPADGTVVTDTYLSDVLFGVWVDGADHVRLTDNRIEGREDVERRTDRGNGINLWETSHTLVEGNEITDVRDGIYYSWAEHVVSRNNTMWDNRYGVHFMYSDDNVLRDNLAVDNDVGYALMVSDRLEVANNTAVRNHGTSGHGILLKDIEDSTITGNVLVENRRGLYVYNAQHNRLADNLLLRNDVGIHHTADSTGQTVVGNSLIHNDQAVTTTTRHVLSWNDTERGNYWSDARTVDLDGDGTSEVRHRPAGIVEHLVAKHPKAAVFADSPAFDAVRLAEDSFPVLETPGIVDRHPLTDPPHDWRQYADTR